MTFIGQLRAQTDPLLLVAQRLPTGSRLLPSPMQEGLCCWLEHHEKVLQQQGLRAHRCSVGLMLWPFIPLPWGGPCREVGILEAGLALSVKSRDAEVVKGKVSLDVIWNFCHGFSSTGQSSWLRAG